MGLTPREHLTPLVRTAAGRWRRVASVVAGAGAAALPVLALAADEQDRVLEQSPSFWLVALITLLTAGGILLVASLGRMYQRQRGIRWRFQDPDAPHDSGH